MKKILLCLMLGVMCFSLVGCGKTNNSKEIDKFSITTNKGNVIETEYEDFGEFSLKIPKDFQIMSDEAIAIKYPNGNVPSLVYTNEDGTINVALNLNDVTMKDSDIKAYIKVMEETYEQYVESIDVEYFEKDNHQIGQIEFISPAIDTEIYNRLIAFSVDGKLRIASFNCTEEYIDEWEDVSEFIINSITFE